MLLLLQWMHENSTTKERDRNVMRKPNETIQTIFNYIFVFVMVAMYACIRFYRSIDGRREREQTLTFKLFSPCDFSTMNLKTKVNKLLLFEVSCWFEIGKSSNTLK